MLTNQRGIHEVVGVRHSRAVFVRQSTSSSVNTDVFISIRGSEFSSVHVMLFGGKLIFIWSYFLTLCWSLSIYKHDSAHSSWFWTHITHSVYKNRDMEENCHMFWKVSSSLTKNKYPASHLALYESWRTPREYIGLQPKVNSDLEWFQISRV